ncbi:glycoside hydrolase family 38 C-terminal domain-containing protein [Lacrimispora sp.]|uniref:glycoside hydrolase family 38 N-terminal domain-containing protein n=1 Tax=Lacrimispora sp. TaxID=2719234 RepID=UPI0034610A25
MAKVHIVNHTHWDREWYFTTADALVLSDNCFTEVLDELEKNRRAMFCLDGQSSIIEEYLEIRPERAEQIRKFVEQGRLSIGPWYTQTDAFFVSGESMIRNLILGIRDCKKYGGYMNIGYLPDTFGFNAQLPTILKNCGIDSAIFFRGINFENHVRSPYFIWKGLSGKEVMAVNLVKGYGAAAFLEDSEIYINNKLLPITELIKAKSGQNEILVPIGEDQLDIVPDLPEKLESISTKTADSYVISSYEQFMDYLRKQDQYEVYEGEFREPCLSRVHKTIGSVRYDVKRINFILEQKLLNRVEPLMAIARANQITVSEKLLNKAWKKMLETHAHDGMGGCVSDNVAVDIFHRMKEAEEIADGIENVIAKRLSEQIGLKSNEILVFNTLPYAYTGYKKIQVVAPSKKIRLIGHEDAMILETKYYPPRDHVRIVDAQGERYITEPAYYKLTLLCKLSLPALGYQVVTFEENSDYQENELHPADSRSIANEFYTVTYNNHQIELVTSFGKQMKDFIVFEDCGNDGDTYDFSPLEGDRPVLLSLDLDQVLKTPVMQQMILKGHFQLPARLSERLIQDGEKGALDIELKLSLLQNVNRLDVHCKVDNQIYSHRLRAKINTDILAQEAIASLPFGYIKRPVLKELPADWKKHYVEMPIDIEPYESSVSVEGNGYYLTAFAKGMKEYQMIDDSLYLTLFSSTGQLGKENLIYRPGRASGDTTRQGHEMIETPMAELIGELEFEWSLQAGSGCFDEYQTAKTWEEYSLEHISYQSQTLNKFIFRLDNKIQPRELVRRSEPQFSLLEIKDSYLFSSISPSLYSDAALLRIKNPTGREVNLTDYDFSRFRAVEKVNDIEEICENQDFIIPPYDTLTLKLSF